MKILIGADISVTKSNNSLFASGNVNELVGTELKSILDDADFRIFNLEGPITNSNSAISKCGPNLKMAPDIISGIKALNPSILTLANNHIMDYGKLGYEETISLLKENEIEYFGTGDSIYSIAKTHILEKDGIKIGIYSCAEHEFTIAKSNYPGANPYDPLETFDDICELKQECDYVVVLYHGGKEYYRYPSPDLQKRFRKMSDKGADLVIAQHTHCIGCKEDYNNSTLIYGQGNFIFDAVNDEYWNSGLLVELNLSKKQGTQEIEKNISYIPYNKITEGRIRLATESSKDTLLEGFFNRSEEIKTECVVSEKFQDFSKSLSLLYLNALHGNNFFFRVMRKIFGQEFVRKLYSKPSSYNQILNFIECECHREVLLAGLKTEEYK